MVTLYKDSLFATYCCHKVVVQASVPETPPATVRVTLSGPGTSWSVREWKRGRKRGCACPLFSPLRSSEVPETVKVKGLLQFSGPQICLCLGRYVLLYVCMFVCEFVYVCMCIRVCVLDKSSHIQGHLYVYMLVCDFVYVYMCIRVCVCVRQEFTYSGSFCLMKYSLY